MRIEFIERYPIAALTPADYNPRKLAEDKFLKLQESIRRFGVIKPVIVNGDNGILTAGHQRTRAMIALGMTHCPAVRINGITQVDEIRFNLFHNSVETNKSKARVCGNLSAGQYHIVQPDHLSYEKNDNATIVFEMGRLIMKYGEWGSIVCNTRGDVLLNSDYAVASKQLKREVICYVIRDEDEQDMLELLGIEYGQYYYDSLGVKSYNQLLCQMHRLNGGGKHDLKSTTYERYVIPRLRKDMRIIDFGAGRCAYAQILAGKGYHILPYEPHFQREEKLDVREVVRQIRLIERDIARSGLFNLVVLDSVLNSVVNSKFEHYVLTACNALASKNGMLILGTRNKGFLDKALDYKYTNAPSRNIEFLDKENFSATFRAGVWTIQHFHTHATLRKLLEEYFYDVEIIGVRSASQIYAIAKRPRKLDDDRVREALEIEFNMEYPGEYRHNQHKGLVELIMTRLKGER